MHKSQLLLLIYLFLCVWLIDIFQRPQTRKPERVNMEHNLYDNDYYDDDSDTLIMDLSDICDKSYDSEEENETLLE